MTPEHFHKFNLIEDSRLRICYMVSVLDDEAFNRSRVAGKWSLGQVIFHLVQVEQFSVNYVTKKIQYRENLKQSGMGASFRYFLLKLFLRLPVKYKAPAAVSTVPEKISKEELLNNWENIRKEMAKLLDNFPEELRDKNIFKHLVAGRLNISQMLDFIHEHINHHQRQIDEML